MPFCLEKRKIYQQKYQKVYIAKFKRLAYDILGNKCACCGETNPVFLSLDHIHNDGYIDRVLRGRRTVKHYQEIASGKYPDKFQLLCMNCNWAKRYGICPHQMGA